MNPRSDGFSKELKRRVRKGVLGNGGSAPGKQVGELSWAESTSRFVTPVDSA